MRRSGPTYTEDTLRALHDEGHGQLWFIVGADALLDLPHWHDPAALIELARFAVAPRPDHPLDLDALERRVPGLRAAVDMIAMEPIDLSATAIRAGGALDDRIPAAVREYAARHDLYTAGQ